jgi:hypothetical protein
MNLKKISMEMEWSKKHTISNVNINSKKLKKYIMAKMIVLLNFGMELYGGWERQFGG